MVVYYPFDIGWFDLSFDADQSIVAAVGCQDYQFADHLFIDTHHYFCTAAAFVACDHCLEIGIFQLLDGRAEIFFDSTAAFIEGKDLDTAYPHRFGKHTAYFHQERTDRYAGYVILFGEIVEQLVHTLAISCLAE